MVKAEIWIGLVFFSLLASYSAFADTPLYRNGEVVEEISNVPALQSGQTDQALAQQWINTILSSQAQMLAYPPNADAALQAMHLQVKSIFHFTSRTVVRIKQVFSDGNHSVDFPGREFIAVYDQNGIPLFLQSSLEPFPPRPKASVNQRTVNTRRERAANAVTAANDINSPLASANPDIIIFDAGFDPVVILDHSLGSRMLRNGQDARNFFDRIFRRIPAAARSADTALRFASDFYLNHFKFNGWDGHGTPLRAAVNASRLATLDILQLRENAMWLMSPMNVMIFGFGGKTLDNFESAIDVVTHEYTHAVTQATADLGNTGMSGALNEHFADVFGQLAQIEHGDVRAGEEFYLGENVLTDREKRNAIAENRSPALRDMLEPHKSHPLPRMIMNMKVQPERMSEVNPESLRTCQPMRSNDSCGAHTLNGIPNRTFSLIAQSLGWNKTRDLYFNVLVSRMQERSNFQQYGKALISECSLLYSAADCEIVRSALRTTEILP